MADTYPRSVQGSAPQRAPFGAKKSSQAEIIQKQIGQQMAKIASRIKIIEDRLDTLRTHVELLDNSMIEKHKRSMSEIHDLQDSMRSLKSDVDEIKDFSERIAKRLEAFASKEEVKVLERYVDAWQPLNYITRSELKDTVKSILSELGYKKKR